MGIQVACRIIIPCKALCAVLRYRSRVAIFVMCIIGKAYAYISLSSISIMPSCCSFLATNSAKRDIISEVFIFVQFCRHFWLINHQTSCLVCVIHQGNFRSRLDSLCYDRLYLIHYYTSLQLKNSIRQKNHQYDIQKCRFFITKYRFYAINRTIKKYLYY